MASFSWVTVVKRNKKILSSENYKYDPLVRVFQHPDLYTCVSQYLNYLECLSLGKAMCRVAPLIKKKLPSFRNHVLRQLSLMGLSVSFLETLQESKGVLTGSFLLHCLLTPLGEMKVRSKIFPEDSDIDLLFGRNVRPEIKCETCLRRVYSWFQELPRKTPTLQGLKLLEPSSLENMESNLSLWGGRLEPDGRPPRNTAFYELRCQRRDDLHLLHMDSKFTKTSQYLCARGQLLKWGRAYEAMSISWRALWDLKGTKVDEVYVHVSSKIGESQAYRLHQWITKTVDFDFCRNSFDGRFLRINKPFSLLKRNSGYSVPRNLHKSIANMASGSETRKDWHESNECLKMLEVYFTRREKYQLRDFKVIPDLVITKETARKFVEVIIGRRQELPGILERLRLEE